LTDGFTTTTMEPSPTPELMELDVIEAAIRASKGGADIRTNEGFFFPPSQTRYDHEAKGR
jgi:hypothetical protein